MFRVKNSKGKYYYLHAKQVQLKNGNDRQIYYFAKEPDSRFTVPRPPADMEVVESKNGLPVLRKKRA